MVASSTDRFNGVVASTAVKSPCVAVALTNITLSGEQTVNGVAVVAGDRVLVTAQTSSINNGIYEASTSGWTRAADFDGNRDVVKGTLVTVNRTTGQDFFYQVDSANPITIGTSLLTFSLTNNPNVSYPITLAEVSYGLVSANITDSYLPGEFERYGADGDGLNDDGVAINNAIGQSLQTDVDAAVPFGSPGNTYLCTTWTPVDSTAVIRLKGHGYTLKGPSTQVDFCRPGTTVEISPHVYFDHWLSGFERETADSGTLVKMSFDAGRYTDFSGKVINLERALANFRLSHSFFENTDGGYVVRLGTNSYANQQTWEKLQLLFNHFKDVDGASTLSTSPALIYGKDVAIIGNIVEGISQTGTGEAWGFYTKALYGLVALNQIDNIVADGNSDNSGLNIKGTARGTSVSPNGIGSLTLANIIRNIGASNVRGIGIRSQADEHYIMANFIEDAGLTGILIDGVSCDHCAALFNRIIFATDTGTIGISLAQAGTGIRSIGDEVVNAATGIRVATDALNTANNVVVSDAMLRVTGSAILASPSTTAINGLLLVNNVVPAATNGIQFNSGTLQTNVRVLDNDLSGATTEIGGTIPADIQIRHCFTVQTTDATATQAISLALPDESLFRVEARIVAKSSDTSERAMYHRTALVYRDAAGSATIQGSVVATSADVEVTAGMEGTITVNGNSVRVTVTGVAATTIDWKVELNVLGIG